jgi:ribonuclease HI
MLKLNCDGAFSDDSNSGGWGWIIRDTDGDAILARCGRVEHFSSSLQADEVISCLQGVQAAIVFGIRYLEVETYALMVK